MTASGTKWVLDGTPIERTAAMREPYADRPDTSGQMYFSQHDMEDMLRESLQNNDQLLLHIVGDRTIETFLNAMDATGGTGVWAKRRVRFEHWDGLMPDLIPRAKTLGVVLSEHLLSSRLTPLTLRFGRIGSTSLPAQGAPSYSLSTPCCGEVLTKVPGARRRRSGVLELVDLATS